jgi:hypothetical protein
MLQRVAEHVCHARARRTHAYIGCILQQSDAAKERFHMPPRYGTCGADPVDYDYLP